MCSLWWTGTGHGGGSRDYGLWPWLPWRRRPWQVEVECFVSVVFRRHRYREDKLEGRIDLVRRIIIKHDYIRGNAIAVTSRQELTFKLQPRTRRGRGRSLGRGQKPKCMGPVQSRLLSEKRRKWAADARVWERTWQITSVSASLGGPWAAT